MAERYNVDFFAELEKQGEDQVREGIAVGIYSAAKTRLAEEWLRRKDQERSERRASHKKTMETVAAIAAIVAAVAATIGAISSTIILFSN